MTVCDALLLAIMFIMLFMLLAFLLLSSSFIDTLFSLTSRCGLLSADALDLLENDFMCFSPQYVYR